MAKKRVFKSKSGSSSPFKKNGADLWVKNFDIRRPDYNLAYESLIGFRTMPAKTIGKNLIAEAVWVVKDGDCFGMYFKKNELRRTIVLTLEEILQNPGRVDRVHKQAIKLNWDLFFEAEKDREIDFSKLTDKQLVSIHRRLYRIIHTSHMWSIATTWFLDSDGEDYTHFLMDFLEKRIGQREDDLLLRRSSSQTSRIARRELAQKFDVSTVFSVLTTPQERSFTKREEEESLNLLQTFRKSPAVKKWFVSHTTSELSRTLDSLPESFRKKIIQHHYKWLWLPYTYVGPAYDVGYFLEVWRELLHEDVDAAAKLKAQKAKRKAIQMRRKQIIGLLKLSVKERKLFDIASDIIWLKGFRKDTYFYAFYVLDLLLSEVAARAGLTLMQAKHLVPGEPLTGKFSEIGKALKGGDFSGIANERMKFSALHAVKGGVEVLTGKPAKKLFDSMNVESIKLSATGELKGTCACPGKAKGAVKIVNVPADIPKMNSGDIMLAHTTFPALVPAMKKAAAIITEDGGITCHAAIVARELQTPCIVGVKGLLSALKDGDRVEIDANAGTVRKL